MKFLQLAELCIKIFFDKLLRGFAVRAADFVQLDIKIALQSLDDDFCQIVHACEIIREILSVSATFGLCQYPVFVDDRLFVAVAK